MDADQLDLKLAGRVLSPGRGPGNGWIGVRGEIVAGLSPAGSATSAGAAQVISAMERLWMDAAGAGTVDDLLSREEPVPADPGVCSALAEAADWTGRPDLRLPSYAGHDANQMAKIVPVGMLFAPSRDGRNHCPEEWTEPDDIAVCLASLTAVVIWLDEELEP